MDHNKHQGFDDEGEGGHFMVLQAGGRRIRLAVSIITLAAFLAAVPLSSGAVGQEIEPADHLLLTEFAVTPTTAEMIEIHNPTDSAVDLTDVFLTDATFAGGSTYYYNIVTGSNSGGGGFGDFHSRFPAGASIGAGEYQTIALNGSDNFAATYGVDPTYELFEDGAADGIPDMLEATTDSINGQGGLSNDGEVVILYHWDGASDLVTDLDYVVYGDKNEAVDKTGVIIDGPDAGTDGSIYADDTAGSVQDGLNAANNSQAHADGMTLQRSDLSEGAETQDGGNGLTGDDETSENLPDTWGETDPTPNAATTLDPPDPGGDGPGPLPDPGVCGDPFTAIYDIQGDGSESPLFEEGVVTEGVVTAVYPQFNGFYLQDAAGDGDGQTSDGIFVNAPTDGVAVDQSRRVVGHVNEFFELTELTSLTDEDVIVLDCGAGTAIAPTSLTLPVPFGGDFEPFEGMLMSFPKMTVTDSFNLARFGEVELSFPNRLRTPTDLVLPGAQNDSLQDINNRSRIILDDASSDQNPDPTPYLTGDGTLRLGDMVDDLVGIVTCNFGCHKIEPVGAVAFDSDGRPDGPGDVGGAMTVGAFNVLNYFTTLGDDDPNARGADNAEELERQTDKLVAAIMKLDADVVALQELENNGAAAIGALVEALNAAYPVTGAEPWAFVEDPEYPGGLESTNAIKVGIIYRQDRVSPVGGPAVSLDEDFALDRPPIAQAFDKGGEVVTVVANHFKSKSCTNTGPDEPFPDEADAGDGQGCFNPRRTRQAMALIDFVAGLQQATGDPDVLAIGDFNSYAQEDPIHALRDGMVDVTEALATGDRYTFTFFGQSGQLDYAFATDTLARKVSGVDIWHINTDEPRFLDYNTENNPPAAFNVDEFRSSDHDPVLVGIGEPAALAPLPALHDVLAALEELVPTGDDHDDTKLGKAILRLGVATDAELWIDDENPANAKRVLTKTRGAAKALMKVDKLDVSAALDELVRVADVISLATLDRAVETGGDESLIAKAEKQRSKAVAAAATGNAKKAIKHYKKAWRRAAKAMEAPVFATYNASLNRFNFGDVTASMASGSDAQVATVTEIIQRTRPNVLLINEFDFDASGLAAHYWQENYLGIGQNGADPISYPFVYHAPSNTGIDSGFDLDNSGSVGGPGDAFGFGFFEGQFGMLVLSQHPLATANVRTFQNFLWKDMPGALLPDDPATPDPADWYSPDELDVFRLSSKSHWDVPVVVGREHVHFLVSHPTPPVFDGPEDRNGTRNHDEIRLWADYVDPAAGTYIYDDDGGTGGLYEGAKFVIAGDQNSDPFDGDSIPGSAQQLTESPLVNTAITPSSEGGPEQDALQGGINVDHLGDPAFDTADFSDSAPGNLRVDYVLPSINMDMIAAAVFWPLESDPLFPLVGTFPFPSSDHKLVWINIEVR